MAQNPFDNIKGKNLSILKAILKSRKYAAYYILWVQALKLLLTPLDMLFRGLEKLFVREKEAPEHPMIFIVGPHRSGTTFISQVWAHAFPFHPLSNFNSVFHRSCYLAHKLFKPWNKKRTMPRYRNFYGIAPGLFTIGDTHEVWDRWYGGDHSIVPEQLSESQKEAMRRYFGTLEKAGQRPLITKSGRNSMIMGELQKTFPTAFFIIVRRDLASIIRSTIQADETFLGQEQSGWGMRASKGFNPGRYPGFLEAVCAQCLGVQQKVDEEQGQLPPEQCMEIDYEAFCKDPLPFLEDFSRRMKDRYRLEIHPDEYSVQGIRSSSSNKGQEELLGKIRQTLTQLQA